MDSNEQWYVFDPNPELPEEMPGPKLYGVFTTQDEADEYANVIHPDDMSGDAITIPLTRVVP